MQKGLFKRILRIGGSRTKAIGGLTAAIADVFYLSSGGMMKKTVFLAIMLSAYFLLASCAHELTSTKISKPDEHIKVYEAKERIVLLAVAATIREKEMGDNIVIDEKNRKLESDFVESGGWRTRTSARVQQLNWKECELILSVITEKKKKESWEMHRLLGKEQYQKLFSLIEIKIYEEMAKAH